MGGSKKTESKTVLPEPTEEEKQNAALLNAVIEAQMTQNGFVKNETRVFEFTRQAEINAAQGELDRLNEQLDNLGPVSGGFDPNANARKGIEQQIVSVNRQIEAFKQEGGAERIDVDFVETPEAKARREQREARLAETEELLFDASKKLLEGDFSVTDEQRREIDELIGDNFEDVIDELKIQFSSAEDAVNDAVDRLVSSGKAELAESARTNQLSLSATAARLGRSGQDTTFTTAQSEFVLGAQERLAKAASTDAANAVANLRQTQALSIGGVKEQEALARFNLLTQAAQPLTAFGAGTQFAQLQGALRSQDLANNRAIGDLVSGELGQLRGVRSAQPTTTTTRQVGLLDILGGAIGLGASGASAAFTGINTFK